MNNSATIESKLAAFISRYYKNELLRGLLFFVAIGASYFLLVLLIEYFLWLNPQGRAVLFWSFIVFEAFLLLRFILLPLARLFKLAKGIDFDHASVLIGSHFPEVRDKLINTLQLKSLSDPNDLALASIAQKDRELEPIPFSLAIDYRKNSKYFKYALMPVLLFVVLNFTDGNFFGSSYERVINYKTAYQPPAPFSFYVVSEELKAIENEQFTIRVKTVGMQTPEAVKINLNGSSYFMKNDGAGSFFHTLNAPDSSLPFSFSANGVSSQEYQLEVVRTPLISDFMIFLDYPAYTGKMDESVENTGSLNIPEGTVVRWQLSTKETERVEWIGLDSTYLFENLAGSKGENFQYSNSFYKDTKYSIATSNANLDRYERLDYTIDVIRDLPPEIELETKKDTVNGFQNYHRGVISDDYGLESLRIIYYTENQLSKQVIVPFQISGGTVDQFIAVFPGDYNLEEGKSYNYFFEVRDNDVVNGSKSTRSEVFTFRKATKGEREKFQLEEQGKTIDNLSKSLQKMKDQKAELESLQKIQKEKNQLSFNEKQQLKSFLQKQKGQDELMEQFAQKLRQNLEELEEEGKSNEENKLLQKRLMENEERLQEQEKLMEELARLQDKLSKEELSEKLDKLAKENKNSKRSMEQLLELTKRFYIQTKTERIAREIESLGKEQEKLSTERKVDELKEQQQMINEFEQLEQDISDLKKESRALKRPIEIPEDIPLQESIKKDQQDASQELQKSSGENPEPSTEDNQTGKKAADKQEQAGKKMQELGKKMRSELAGQGGEQLQEDVRMLRQILDNLILFSFNEEELMIKFRNIDNRNPGFSGFLVRQNNLRENFMHIDDSLFALSLRNPGLEEEINKQLTNVTYSLDQSLERLADNRIDQGTASVQYVVTGANSLADMLSEILANMQEQLSMSMGSGSGGVPIPGQGGKGDGQQLSDIIMSQQELAKELGDGAQGENKKRKEGMAEGNNSGKGKSADDADGFVEGEGDGLSESEIALQYEIFKKQQQLRKELEDLIRENGLGEEAAKLAGQMENIEDKLLSGGLNQDLVKRMNEISHQLMKLESAEMEQGRDKDRESEVNRIEYQNSNSGYLPVAREYFNLKELLNREALPLSIPFVKKVQAYYTTEQ